MRAAAGFALALLAFAGFLWVLLVPQEAEKIGHRIDNPQYLLGCYFAGDTQIRLEEDWAEFDGVKVPISFGERKALREVLYPERFPWFDPAKGAFRFKSDRYDLINIEQDDNGAWFLQIWNSAYLEFSLSGFGQARRFELHAVCARGLQVSVHSVAPEVHFDGLSKCIPCYFERFIVHLKAQMLHF